MKRYDSLRQLFWVLAAGLSTTLLQAVTTETANSSTPVTATVGTTTYDSLTNFNQTGDPLTAVIGTTGASVTFNPGIYAHTLTLIGNNSSITDNITFDSGGTGPLTISFAPNASQAFTNSGTYVSSRQSDVLDISGASGSSVIFTGDLSGFQSHLQQTSGDLTISGSTGVMTTGSGQISILVGAGTTTLSNTAARTVGTSSHIINIAAGKTLVLEGNGELQTIASKIQGDGALSVTAGQHLLSGSPITHAGGITVSGGELQLGSATNSNITTSGTGKLTFTNTSAAMYAGRIIHNGSGGIEVNVPNNTVTLANPSSGSPNTASQPITITAGQLNLENYGIFLAGTYNGSGAVKFDNSVDLTLSAASAVDGALSMIKSGTGTLTISGSGALKTTGPLAITAGELRVNAGGFDTAFTQANLSDIAITSGASLRAILGTSGLTLARRITGHGSLILDADSTNAPVTLSNNTISVTNIVLDGIADTGFSLIFTGTVPSSSIDASHNTHTVDFRSVSGIYNQGAITGDGSVLLSNASSITFQSASVFNGALTVIGGSTARLEDASILNNRTYNVSGSNSKLQLVPAQTYDFSSASVLNTGDASGTIEILGGSTSATAITLSAAQPFLGSVNLTDAYISLTAADALSSASNINLYNDSSLVVGSSVSQTFKNLATASTVANLVIGSGSDITLEPTANQTFSGIVSSSGGNIIHSSTHNQIFNGDLSGFQRNLTTSSTGVLDIQSDITLGAGSNTYTVANEGTLKFTNVTASISSDFTINTARASLDSVTLQYLSTATGASKTISGSGGLVIGNNGALLEADFGRSVISNAELGLKVDGVGIFSKKGFGTFELSGALSTAHDAANTSAISVDLGTLKLVGAALTGSSGVINGDSDISVSAQSKLQMALDANRNFERVITGGGSIELSVTSGTTPRYLNLTATAELKNKGDLTIGAYTNLTFNDNDTIWQPGAASKIEINNNGQLKLGGKITPDGAVFNPFFTTPGGTIYAGGDTVITVNSDRRALLIGNTDDTLQLDSGATVLISASSGQRAEMRYNLTSGGVTSAVGLTPNSTGTLFIEGTVLDGFQGVIQNAATGAGNLWLKDISIKTDSSGTNFNFGSHAAAITTFELSASSLTLGSNNTVTGTGGVISKIGVQRLIFDATNSFSTLATKINIYDGSVELHRVTRAAGSAIEVFNRGRLVAWRDYGGTPSDINLQNLTLHSGSELYITDRSWTTSTNMATSDNLADIVIENLTTHAGAEITFIVDAASGGATGTSNQTFSSAMLSINQDYSSNISAITAPLYIRLAPALAGTNYQSGTVYSLIEFANSGSATNFATKIKLRPTIGTLTSYEGGLGTLPNGVSGRYAQLYLASDNTGSNYKYLVAQINTNSGFAPGLRASNKSDFTATAYPAGTYTVTSFLESLMAQNFAAYSALDGVLAGIMTHNRQLDYHLSLLSPSSYQQSAQLFHSGSVLMQAQLGAGLSSIAEEQRWSAHNQTGKNKAQIAGIMLQLQKQQQLQSDTQIKKQGALQSWDSQVSAMSFNDGQAQHVVDARVLGLAWKIGSGSAIGYQHVNSSHHYQTTDKLVQGHQNSVGAQAFSQITRDNITLQTLSSAFVHQYEHQRHIAVEVDESLIDKWTARSSYSTTEIQQQGSVAYKQQLSQDISLDIGISGQAHYSYTPKFAETGADNLSLVIEPQHHSAVLVTPNIALDSRYIAAQGWGVSRLILGYQKVLHTRQDMAYGFKDIAARYTSEAAQPQFENGFVLGYQATLAHQGLSLQLNYQNVLGQNQQAQVSLSYEF